MPDASTSELTPIAPVEPANQADEQAEQAETTSEILVDIKGAVLAPGVYQLEMNSRVQDAIEKAGGFTEVADQTVINLAQKVFDEMVLMVPEKGETVQNSAGDAQHAKVRINYATEEEIQQLTGIGPAKAKAIIEHRETYGTFSKLEDLLEISGIGEKTLEIIQEEIQIP